MNTETNKDGEVIARKPVNPMIILAVIIVIAAIATYVIPAGSFDRVANPDTGYDLVDIDSFAGRNFHWTYLTTVAKL